MSFQLNENSFDKNTASVFYMPVTVVKNVNINVLMKSVHNDK